MRTLVIIFFSVFFLSLTTPPDVKLEYAFKVGDQYQWVQSTKQTIKQHVAGMEQKTDNSFENEFAMRVVEITPTGAKLQASFTKLKSEMISPIGNNSMDSHGTDDKAENKIFKSMLNKPFFIFLAKNGTVEKVEGADTLWSGFTELGMDQQRQKAIKESLQMLLGEESLKGQFQSAFVTYPDNKVKQGDSWTTNNEMNNGFPMAIENKWMVESLSSSEARITGDATYSTTDKTRTLTLPGGLKAKSDLSGQHAAKSTVNAKSGWPMKQGILVELKGKMTLLAGSMVPQDMDIPMEMLSETNVTITRK